MNNQEDFHNKLIKKKKSSAAADEIREEQAEQKKSSSTTSATTGDIANYRKKEKISILAAQEKEGLQERSRKRCRDGQDYFLSDGDDGGEDADYYDYGHKKRTYDQKEKNTKQLANKDDEEGFNKLAKKEKDRQRKSKHRDIARKERGEGKSDQDSNLIGSHLDEENYCTNLVKGLDIALADKASRDAINSNIANQQRDEQGDFDLDTKIIDETATSAKKQPTSRPNEVSSLNVIGKDSTNLTSGMMMSYLTRLESIKNEPELSCLPDDNREKKSQVELTEPAPKEKNAYPPAIPQTGAPYTFKKEVVPFTPFTSISGKSDHFPQGAVEAGIFMSHGGFSRAINDDVHATFADHPEKEPPFPVKLHRILSNPEFSDIICWLPHGRSWRVLKPKAFEEKIIPMYFRHAKYASFMRQVNGWGFKRMTQGPDHNSYYHELFVSGMQHLCYKMRRLTKGRVDGDPDYTPAATRQLNMAASLPDHKGQNLNTIINTSNTMVNPSFLYRTSPGNIYDSNGFQDHANSIPRSFPYITNHAGDTIVNSRLNELEKNKFPNSLLQQLQHNLNTGQGQLSTSNLNMATRNLQGLQQRREELLSQIGQLVENNNTILFGSGAQGSNRNTDIGMLNMNTINSNSSHLQNFTNSNLMGYHSNHGIDPNRWVGIQQMTTRFGGSEGPTFFQGNALHNVAGYDTHYPDSNVTNRFRNELGNNLWNLNHQQLLLQSAIGGDSMNHSLGLGGLDYNQITGIMKANNLLIRQQGDSSKSPSGNPSNGSNESTGQI